MTLSLPAFYPRLAGHLTPWSWESIGAELMAIQRTTPASAVYTTSGTAMYVPFCLAEPDTFKKVGWVNGATVAAANNIDMGIYDDTGTGGSPGAKLGTTGVQAQGTASTLQVVDWTDLTLGPGRFYMAFMHTWPTTQGTFLSVAPTAPRCQAFGIMTEAGLTALPATATALKNTTWAYLPLFGFTRTTVF